MRKARPPFGIYELPLHYLDKDILYVKFFCDQPRSSFVKSLKSKEWFALKP
ncbi:hypothetical protein HMPREF1705_04655 [Acetomicrobium hydrogeniformans ATCC BAA-1850]|uniref:Uncharacterized protein n=1 Tax=Acetomicrobium hydrogeniformans ATCC BAA-1850 TaxID=592015 RepID=A0A0T5XAD5_9BACT|nr:hypothetical protein HMPREF1705_04655 [Acetomicrobium hydrogeniformans ATCC BAA-1850]